MQKFEYMRVQVFVRDGKLSQIVSNGTYPDHSQYSTHVDYLNDLGDAGWELVSEVYMNDKQHWFHLKRPKQ